MASGSWLPAQESMVLPEWGDELSSLVVVGEVTLVSAATAAVSQPAAKIAQALVFRTLGAPNGALT